MNAVKSTAYLHNRIFTMMFLYFIRRDEFEYLLRLLMRTPQHTINAEKIIKQLEIKLKDE